MCWCDARVQLNERLYLPKVMPANRQNEPSTLVTSEGSRGLDAVSGLEDVAAGGGLLVPLGWVSSVWLSG